MKISLPSCLAVCLLTLISCSDDSSSFRDSYSDTDLSIVLDRQQPNAPEVFTPYGMVQYDSQSFLYLDRGRRQLIKIGIRDAARTLAADLADIEEALNDQIPYRDAWGEALIEAGSGWFIIAGTHRALTAVNVAEQKTMIIGKAGTAAADLDSPDGGKLLSEIDFSSFSGIGKGADKWYLSFGNQVYAINIDASDPIKSFAHSPLIRIAGGNQQHFSHDPLLTPLSLPGFTHFVEHNNILYFWDDTYLYAVKDGKITIVTGQGSQDPDVTLDDFFSYNVRDSTPFIYYGSAFYTPFAKDSRSIVRFQIDTLSFDDTPSQGYAASFPLPVGAVTSWTAFNDSVIAADASDGSFYMYSGDSFQNGKTIYTSPKLDTLLSENGMFGALSIMPLYGGRGFLTYSPTLGSMQYIDAASHKTTPIWNGFSTNIMSDGGNYAWFDNHYSFYFITISDKGELTYSYVPRFFNRPDPTGAPCNASDLFLPDIPQIASSKDNLFIYQAGAARVLKLSANSDKSVIINASGWTFPDSPVINGYHAGLITELVQFWSANGIIETAVLSYNHRQYLIVGNLSSHTVSAAGLDIQPEKYSTASGLGETPLADGVSASDTKLENLLAAAVSSDSIIYAADASGLYSLQEDGAWHLHASCAIPKNIKTVSQFRVHGTSDSRWFSAKFDGQSVICGSKGNFFGNAPIPASWTAPSDNYHDIDRCYSNIYAAAKDSMLCIVRETSSPTPPKCTQTADGIIPDTLACSNSTVYYTAQYKDRQAVFKADFTGLNHGKMIIGSGNGLKNTSPISQASIGTSLGRMAADNNHTLYFWMKDTCAVWKMPLPDDREIEANDPIELAVRDNKLCNAESFGASASGTLGILSDGQLLLWDEDTFEAAADVPGVPIDMIGINEAFIIMTDEGLYVYENGQLEKKYGPEIDIDGETIRFAVKGSFYPRMAQSPGENGILIPVFSHSRIIKLPI